MVEEIAIDDEFEEVYDLSSIGLSGELVKFKDSCEIITDVDYFPFKSIENFVAVGDIFILRNDDMSEYKIDKEKFEILKEIL